MQKAGYGCIFTEHFLKAYLAACLEFYRFQPQVAQPGGKLLGALVAPALVAALAVMSQSGDYFRGGIALFSMSLGMGAPLLAVGAAQGKLLPKAGPWMDAVKAVFGVLLLGLGIWMLERVAPAALTMALWAALLIAVPGLATWLPYTAGFGR